MINSLRKSLFLRHSCPEVCPEEGTRKLPPLAYIDPSENVEAVGGFTVTKDARGVNRGELVQVTITKVRKEGDKENGSTRSTQPKRVYSLSETAVKFLYVENRIVWCVCEIASAYCKQLRRSKCEGCTIVDRVLELGLPCVRRKGDEQYDER